MLPLKEHVPGRFRELYLSVKFFLKRRGIAILMYHSIGDNENFFTVRADEFARQMKYLKDNKYQVISLSKLVEILESDQILPKKTIVLTFDDGYQDNYNNAFPILKEHNFPAAIFLASGLVSREITNRQNISLPLLSWEQIQEMHDSGLVDFEPHTVNHIRLHQVDIDEAEKEIVDSKREIEQRLNKKCPFFCYPGGRYNKEIIDVLKNNEFKAARSTINGYVQKGDNPFELKKVPVRSTASFFLFKLKI